jgi:hypothetical protein
MVIVDHNRGGTFTPSSYVFNRTSSQTIQWKFVAGSSLGVFPITFTSTGPAAGLVSHLLQPAFATVVERTYISFAPSCHHQLHINYLCYHLCSSNSTSNIANIPTISRESNLFNSHFQTQYCAYC